MKKIIVLFIAVFIQLANAHCQSVQISSTNINQGGFDYATVIGQINEEYVLLQSNIPLGTDKERVGLKTRKLQMSFFDNKLTRQWQMPVVSGIAGGNIENISVFNDHIFIIYSLFNKENSLLDIYCDQYDKSGKSTELKNKLGSFTISKYNDLEKTRVLFSQDKKSFGIYINESNDAGQNIHLITYSSEGKIKNKNFQIKYSNSLLYLNNFMLANEGDFYLSGQLKNKENKKQRSQYLFCFLTETNSVVEKMVTDFNSPISDLIIKYNPVTKEVVCGGIGVDNNSYTGSGIKLVIADSLLNFREVNYAIQGSSLKDLVGERNSSGMSLDNYTIQEMILREDGGALMVAEAQYMSEYSFYDQFTQTFNRRTEYHFDNIVLFSVDATGKIDWCKVIKKDQVSMDDFGIFSSFASYNNNEEIGVLYNKDSGRNFELMHFLISKDGQLSSKRINKSNIDAIIPKYNRQTGATETCVPVIIKKQLFLAKFEFE